MNLNLYEGDKIFHGCKTHMKFTGCIPCRFHATKKGLFVSVSKTYFVVENCFPYNNDINNLFAGFKMLRSGDV